MTLDPRSITRDLLLNAPAERGLPEEIRAATLELGPAALDPLVEIVDDDSLHDDEAPGGGWAPIHACDLIGALGDAAAVPTLLGVLERTDLVDYLHMSALNAVVELGPEALEPVLELHARTHDGDLRMSLSEILGKLDVRDDRVLRALLLQLEERVEFGAGCLAEYGDPAALPKLSAALDVYRLSEDATPMADHAVIELRHAIEELGGTLSPSQKAKVAKLRQRQLGSMALLSGEEREGAPVVRRPKLGRNQPCWCGSGKKYKRCHLPQERQ